MLHEMKKERKKGKKERFDFKYRFESISCEIKIPEEICQFQKWGMSKLQAGLSRPIRRCYSRDYLRFRGGLP